MNPQRASAGEISFRDRSGPLTDLGLTLPVFVGYHLGVVWLDVRNAADIVTHELKLLANDSLLAYSGLTLGIGAVFASVLLVLGRGQALRWERFALVALEGVLYAVAMRALASYVVGRVHLGPSQAPELGAFSGIVMSLGAGFYEEIAFRVVLFGAGVSLIKLVLPALAPLQRTLAIAAWGLAAAAVFSGWHHLGPFGEPFEARAFVFRWVCGLVFTLIYAFRGFAPAVWTHALYDIWVLVF
jgi:membrane protease YdiL (CAAX protease family)